MVLRTVLGIMQHYVLPLIEDTLKEFSHIVNSLFTHNNNIVIGGSYALLAHGLLLGRYPEDLDIIIYTPNNKQMQFLQQMEHSGFFVKNNIAVNKERFSWKFKKGNKILNVLVEYTDINSNLLYICVDGKFYKIQDIEKVITAKSSYFYTNEYTGANYSRTKDVLDVQSLKNLNFNLNCTVGKTENYE